MNNNLEKPTNSTKQEKEPKTKIPQTLLEIIKQNSQRNIEKKIQELQNIIEELKKLATKHNVSIKNTKFSICKYFEDHRNDKNGIPVIIDFVPSGRLQHPKKIYISYELHEILHNIEIAEIQIDWDLKQLTKLSHGICPDCLMKNIKKTKMPPELAEEILQDYKKLSKKITEKIEQMIRELPEIVEEGHQTA